MDKITCNLTNEELANKVEAELDRLIKTGGRSFTMQIPARVNDDTDLLIAELLTRFRAIEKQVDTTKNILKIEIIDIVTVETLHDLLLDNHKYSLNSKVLKQARALTAKMYDAFK